jgi:alpha-galactosidase
VSALRPGVQLDLVEALIVEDDDEGREDLVLFRNGWQSWSGSSSFGREDRQPVERRVMFVREIGRSPSDLPPRARGEFTSDLCVALSSARAGQAVVFGYLGAAQFGGFVVSAPRGKRARLTAQVPFEGVPLAEGQTRETAPLLMLRGEDASELLEQYAAILGKALGARVPDRSVAGWCSWYQYFAKIDETKIRSNVDALAARRDSLPVSLIQIDDGYESEIGDWLAANDRFPRGLEPLAEEIRQQGFTPGLWLAPFIARPGSRLLAEHPDWFIRNARGRPRRALYNHVWSPWNTAKALDLSHPEVQAWLFDIFRTIARTWGYRFLKLDFLFAAALPGRRCDPAMTGAEALRRGLEIVREAVGEEVHILGCGCPLGPAVGLVDSMRIGPDVTPYWTGWISRFVTRDYGVVPSTKAALRNVLARGFMHRHLWQNDPDCVLVRETETKMTLDEVYTLASLVAVSGGTVLLSDDVNTLSEERARIASTVFAINRDVQGTPRCLDLMTSPFPRLLWASRKGGGGYLAVFNPEDEPRDIVVDFAKHAPLSRLGPEVSARDVWGNADRPLDSGSLALEAVPPHGVRLFLLSDGAGAEAPACTGVAVRAG